MIKKLVISCVFISFFCFQLSAQDKEEGKKKPEKRKVPFNERIFISPDIGLQFGTVTVVNISPKVGYRITEKFAAGLGATYVYLKDKSNKFYSYEANIYGGSVFTQYQLFEPVRAYAEYELLDVELPDYNTYPIRTKREFIPSFLVGGGYTQSIGENSSFGIMLLYNLLDGPKSIYSNPIIRIGFNIGL